MLLEVKSVSLSIGPRAILKDVSFSLEAGHCCSLLGANGSGKTSILRSILGLLPYEGEIFLQGKNIRDLSRRVVAKQVAYVPQIVSELPAYSARDFVALGRYTHRGETSSQKTAEIEAALATTGCLAFADRYVSELSGGERQRVLLATAIAQGSPLILLDEPAASLDPEHETLLYQAIEQLRRNEDRSILVASHDVNRSILASSHVIGLKQGAVLFSGEPKGLLDGTTLKAMYDIPFSLLKHPSQDLTLAFPEVPDVTE